MKLWFVPLTGDYASSGAMVAVANTEDEAFAVCATECASKYKGELYPDDRKPVQELTDPGTGPQVLAQVGTIE